MFLIVFDEYLFICFIVYVEILLFFEIFVLFWDMLLFIDLFNKKYLFSCGRNWNEFDKVRDGSDIKLER